MYFGDLLQKIMAIIPSAYIDEVDGELVIYTGLTEKVFGGELERITEE